MMLQVQTWLHAEDDMFWKQPWDLKAFGKQCKEQWGVTPRPYWAQVKSVTSARFVKGCNEPGLCLCCDVMLTAKHSFLVTLCLAVSCIGLTLKQESTPLYGELLLMHELAKGNHCSVHAMQTQAQCSICGVAGVAAR